MKMCEFYFANVTHDSQISSTFFNYLSILVDSCFINPSVRDLDCACRYKLSLTISLIYDIIKNETGST